MANTFTSLHYHVIFSTKNREPWIRPEIETRVWSYLGGIARENDLKAILIGGIENHVHLLLGIPPTVAVSKAVQLIKGGSSAWLKDAFPGARDSAGRTVTARSPSANPSSRRWRITSATNVSTIG
jgi:REP element-mobilizing transposase RayT